MPDYLTDREKHIINYLFYIGLIKLREDKDLPFFQKEYGELRKRLNLPDSGFLSGYHLLKN